jgi:hypothetical protein
MALKAGELIVMPFAIDQTDLLAPVNRQLSAPCDGVIEELWVIVQAAVTTGGAITVLIDTTTVVGLSVTVADAAAAGTTYSDTPTLPSATRTVTKGQRVQIAPAAAFATAGAVNGWISFRTMDERSIPNTAPAFT